MLSAGFEAQHVPFRGDYMVDVVAGRIDFSVAPLGTVIGLVRDNKLAALAVGAAQQSFALPQVPTLIEAGLKEDAIYPFYTLFAPGRTPVPVLDRIYAQVQAALATQLVRDRAASLGSSRCP